MSAARDKGRHNTETLEHHSGGLKKTAPKRLIKKRQVGENLEHQRG